MHSAGRKLAAPVHILPIEVNLSAAGRGWGPCYAEAEAEASRAGFLFFRALSGWINYLFIYLFIYAS